VQGKNGLRAKNGELLNISLFFILFWEGEEEKRIIRRENPRKSSTFPLFACFARAPFVTHWAAMTYKKIVSTGEQQGKKSHPIFPPCLFFFKKT